jgi:hypothetical protein
MWGINEQKPVKVCNNLAWNQFDTMGLNALDMTTQERVIFIRV